MKHIRLYESSDEPTEVEYYDNGRVKTETWLLDGELHREGGPAEIEYYPSGKIRSKCWLQNGMLNREDGPSIVTYHENGNFFSVEWRLGDEEAPSAERPSAVWYWPNGNRRSETWYEQTDDGYPAESRKGGPAKIEWHENGQVSNERWYIDGYLHREDGPAIVTFDSTGKVMDEYFFLHGNPGGAEEREAYSHQTSEERLIEIYNDSNDWARRLAYANPNFPNYVKDWLDI